MFSFLPLDGKAPAVVTAKFAAVPDVDAPNGLSETANQGLQEEMLLVACAILMNEPSPSPRDGSAFPVTQWTVIIEAVSGNPEKAQAALEDLCRRYRQPIVNWFRRKDFRNDPEDLTHDFDIYLIGKGLLNKVTPRTGKFRCFLAATLRYFLADFWDKERAQKRGGGVEKVPIDENDVIRGAVGSADESLDADFALEIHRKVMERLSPPEDLKRFIFQKDSSQGWNDIGASLKKTAPAIRQEVRRLRRRHWELFSDEVAEIVTPAQRAEETRYLYELLFKISPAE